MTPKALTPIEPVEPRITMRRSYDGVFLSSFPAAVSGESSGVGRKVTGPQLTDCRGDVKGAMLLLFISINVSKTPSNNNRKAPSKGRNQNDLGSLRDREGVGRSPWLRRRALRST